MTLLTSPLPLQYPATQRLGMGNATYDDTDDMFNWSQLYDEPAANDDSTEGPEWVSRLIFVQVAGS